MSDIPTITCPIDCIASFSEAWTSYDHPMVDAILKQNAVYNPVILDIGANVGAFAIWANERWPTNYGIICHEPHPNIYSILQSNISHFEKIRCIMCAIGNPAQPAILKTGRNRLCSGLWDDRTKDAAPVNGIKITILSPSTLPKSNIIKMDCEGSEGYICEHLEHIPEYLVLEYHSQELMMRCFTALNGKMFLAEHNVQEPGLGVMKFFRI